MLPLEIYKNFLLRINKNDTNIQINVSKGEFVILFNEQRLKWLDDVTKNKENDDTIDDISELYKVDVELVKIIDKPLFSEFTLPTDFFKKTSAYCLASKGECKNNVVVCFPFKPKNKSVLIINSNENPSFEYQETLYSISSGKVLVYKTDFNVDKIYLTYYSIPIAIDISGYKKLDGSYSVDIATDLEEQNIGEVLNRCAKIVLGRYQNTEGFQIANTVVQEDKK